MCEKCEGIQECTCFCKCGLPHLECVCGWTKEDFITEAEKIKRDIHAQNQKTSEGKIGQPIGFVLFDVGIVVLN